MVVGVMVRLQRRCYRIWLLVIAMVMVKDIGVNGSGCDGEIGA